MVFIGSIDEKNQEIIKKGVYECFEVELKDAVVEIINEVKAEDSKYTGRNFKNMMFQEDMEYRF